MAGLDCHHCLAPKQHGVVTPNTGNTEEPRDRPSAGRQSFKEVFIQQQQGSMLNHVYASSYRISWHYRLKSWVLLFRIGVTSS